jgi:hypothetical protein
MTIFYLCVRKFYMSTHMLPPRTLFVLQIQNSHIQIDPRTLHPCQIIAIIRQNDINRSTSRKKKKIIMVTPFAGSYGMAMSFFSHPIAATSSRWTVRGLCWAILLNYVNWLRKKLISTLINFILFFGLLSTRSPQNWSDRAPLNSLPAKSCYGGETP